MPFIPSRGVIGTDLVNLHPNWKIIEDPYNEGHDILLVPAIRPDIAMIHAFKADQNGNVLAPRLRGPPWLPRQATRFL